MKIDGSNANNTQQNKNKQPTTLKHWVVKITDQIKNALPSNISPERMQRIALTALTKDPKLAETTPESFIGALLTSAQLGLECNTPLGQAYLIPYKNNKKGIMEAQFQTGYQGLIDLCYRTKEYKIIQARIVYEGDEFEYSYGFAENLIHKPKEKSDKPIYVYAYYECTNGAKTFEVMSWESVRKFSQKYSQSVKGGRPSPWTTDPESMAKKTVLKKVLKYAPKTVELANAISQDSAVISVHEERDSIGSFFRTDVEATDAEIVETKELPKQELKPQPELDEAEEEAINREFKHQAESFSGQTSGALF